MATYRLSTQHEQINIPLVFYGDLPNYEESSVKHHLTESEYHDFYDRLRAEVSSHLKQQRDLGGVFLILIFILIIFLISSISWYIWLTSIIAILLVFRMALRLRKKIQETVSSFLQQENNEVWNSRAIHWTVDPKFKNIQLNLGYYTQDAIKAPLVPQIKQSNKLETEETSETNYQTPKVILDFKAEPPQDYN